MDSDADLIRSVLAGNTDAFGPLVSRYQGGVYALASSILRDFAAAEDVTQEAFITAYTRLSKLRDPALFPAWLRRIAANTARMWLRRSRATRAGDEMAHVAAPREGGGGGGGDAFRERIAGILSSLPEQKREVVILCYLDGFSRKDAAIFLGVSEVALRKRLHDAKRLLQRRIVEAAERSFEGHLLPRDFVTRCICGCKRAVRARTNERKVMSMATEKNGCRCGCQARNKQTKARNKETKGRAKRRSKRTEAAKTAE